ncbi:MAG: hypothetical protein DBX59_02425 [Bacillota bacterium]|nr:MAG: hypothetical protein DBX59_02425 [Bacillota bacterium]
MIDKRGMIVIFSAAYIVAAILYDQPSRQPFACCSVEIFVDPRSYFSFYRNMLTFRISDQHIGKIRAADFFFAVNFNPFRNATQYLRRSKRPNGSVPQAGVRKREFIQRIALIRRCQAVFLLKNLFIR